jgi:hypothetical protein
MTAGLPRGMKEKKKPSCPWQVGFLPSKLVIGRQVLINSFHKISFLFK